MFSGATELDSNDENMVLLCLRWETGYRMVGDGDGDGNGGDGEGGDGEEGDG
jgi:hypothetical protein